MCYFFKGTYFIVRHSKDGYRAIAVKDKGACFGHRTAGGGAGDQKGKPKEGTVLTCSVLPNQNRGGVDEAPLLAKLEAFKDDVAH